MLGYHADVAAVDLLGADCQVTVLRGTAASWVTGHGKRNGADPDPFR